MVTMSTSCLIRSIEPMSKGFTTPGKIKSLLPMNRWSYSKPTDQFGVKAYSNPVPKAPPQRVELAETLAPVKLSVMEKLLSVTAKPLLKYQSHVSQAKPNWPVKSPIASTWAPSVKVGSKRLTREALRLAQAP